MVDKKLQLACLPRMHRVRHIHFIGVGGVGMGGIAEVLLNQGYSVSGSDLSSNAMTERLKNLGGKIFHDHKAANVKSADVIVRSSAVSDDNVEIQAAKADAIPIIPRAQMLAELMRFRHGIAIAGTHGKTTTTSLAASILAEGGLDPTFVIGGMLNSAGCNARLGTGDYLVAEADESDASFLYLQPTMSVVTNIDADHMETYGGDFNKLRQTFIDFLHHLPFYGLAVLCTDDKEVRDIVPKITRPLLTYGFNAHADLQAHDFKQNGVFSQFTVYLKSSQQQFPVKLNLPGKHNVLNALAAIGIAMECGVSVPAIQKSLLEFQGVGRRLQSYGEQTFENGKALLLDDYGHHPREVAATLESVKDAWQRRVVMVYQPHRYTRTRDLFTDFVEVLSQCDELVLLDIYSAGEAEIAGVTSQALAQAITERNGLSPVVVKKQDDLLSILQTKVKENDIVMLQGAGDISKKVKELVHQLSKSMVM